MEAEIPAQVMKKIVQAAEALKGCRSVLVITGAGMSADSGLPTYRGIGGLYNDASTEEGMPIEAALSGDMLAARPEIPWRHIAQIERACRGAGFNRGHRVLAEMEAHFPRFWILTQNVDGLHQAAGSRQVIDIHGDVHDLACMRCTYAVRVADYSGFTSVPPACPECGSVLRPGVVLFNEMLPRDKLAKLQVELHRGFDLVFSIGTSSVFPYIAAPVEAAHRLGKPAVEINPQTTPVSAWASIKIAFGAARALDALWAAYQGSA
jgi:NAD-dependent deacetylase